MRPSLHLLPPQVAANGLPYDCILIDEAQDLNRLTAQLLLAQPGVKVVVGDPHQHIVSLAKARPACA